MGTISVVFVIKNGIKQGYCFWESLNSCLSFANEIIISEGFSDDGTMNYLMKFQDQNKDIPIVINQDAWDDKSYHGEAIANVSIKAIKRATMDWVLYLQADEVWHEDCINYIKNLSDLTDYNAISFPFRHFIKSWEPAKEGYSEAMRMIRNGRNISLMGDAWNFQGEVDPIYPAGHCPKPIYHFAWVFPETNDIKDIEHAKLYENYPEYQEKMKKACESLKEEKKAYPRTDFDDFPEITRKFIGKLKYELPKLK
jgi:glycosyltransferase involved in cell wall biosynthesis